MLERVRSWRPTETVLRRTFLGALVANTVIVVTGGAVRLTASGLGCPTFPRCTDESLVATREMGAHGAIEFGNRLLTFALSAAVLAALVTAWRAGRRDLVRPAGLLLLGIVAQALLGGITVLTGLNPLTVMAHFLLSMGLIAVAVVAYERAAGRRVPVPGAAAPTYVRALATGAWMLTAAVAATLVIGTVVTGTGPHSGDKQAADRLPFDLEAVTQLHADAVFLVVGLTLGMVVAAAAGRAPSLLARRLRVLLAVVLAQGLVGFVQYVTDLPVALVATHMLGACLVWIATLLVLLAAVPARGRTTAGRSVSDAASAGSPPAPVSAAAR
jgi:cytochrome c oxidase assembly protein subunit 15